MNRMIYFMNDQNRPKAKRYGFNVTLLMFLQGVRQSKREVSRPA